MHMLLRKAGIVALCAGALASAGLAAAGPNDTVGATSASTRACFLARQVEGFAARGEKGVNLRVHRDVYQMDFFGPCIEIQDSDQISLRSRGGGDFICNGPDADLVTYSKIGNPRRCTVNNLRKLTPDEVAALPKSEKP